MEGGTRTACANMVPCWAEGRAVSPVKAFAVRRMSKGNGSPMTIDHRAAAGELAGRSIAAGAHPGWADSTWANIAWRARWPKAVLPAFSPTLLPTFPSTFPSVWGADLAAGLAAGLAAAWLARQTDGRAVLAPVRRSVPRRVGRADRRVKNGGFLWPVWSDVRARRCHDGRRAGSWSVESRDLAERGGCSTSILKRLGFAFGSDAVPNCDPQCAVYHGLLRCSMVPPGMGPDVPHPPRI